LASRRRIITYGIAEPLLVALAGGITGVGLAAVGVRLLPLLEARDLPRVAAVTFDWTVSRVSRSCSQSSLRCWSASFPRCARRGRHRVRELAGWHTRPAVHRWAGMRHALVAAQIGLTVALLLGAALLTTSFRRLLVVDPGYRTDHVVCRRRQSFCCRVSRRGPWCQFYARVLDELGRQPGIVSAAAVANLPLAGAGGDLNIQIEGRETQPGTPSRRADWQVVTPGYFDALQITADSRSA
jgi:hypothetical protein